MSISQQSHCTRGGKKKKNITCQDNLEYISKNYLWLMLFTNLQIEEIKYKTEFFL